MGMSQWCGLAVQKASYTLGCTKSKGEDMSREVIVPLYPALRRLRLESCIQLWVPQSKKGVDLLELVQRRPQRCSEGWSTCAKERQAERVEVVEPGEVKANLRALSST